MQNQRFIQLTIDDKLIKSTKLVEQYLINSDFYWLLNCELDNVILEIKDNLLYWKKGTFYYGTWIWGIFEDGEFLSGNWNGGIFLNGTFKANFNNGVFKNGIFKGVKVKGQFE